MPIWYFDRQQIKNSPSFLDGIDTNTENRYRREGARFIIDAGTKMGLRWDTFATGVVYFHRFYMLHSFKEFYRYVTAACCLFLAGKVEETPKKCKDIIKIAQNLLSNSSFLKFGEDPREEVMTMERILLKTIKFDLQVEHPYTFVLKCAKHFKSEEEKVQNMAQMAWTFMNDSLCTPLCLQWEPEIVGVSLMYLASRFTKFEPTDWSMRTGSRSKWWEDFVEGMTVELMEDIGHQMLDLYSNKNKKNLDADSPPNSPSKVNKGQSTPPPPPPDRPPPKRTREEVKSESEPPAKAAPVEKEIKVPTPKPDMDIKPAAPPIDSSTTTGAPIPVAAQHRTPSSTYNRGNSNNSYKSASSGDTDTFSSYNPYVSSRMMSASFMSQEGSQNIQSILAGNGVPHPTAPPPYPDTHNPPPSHHLAPDPNQYPLPAATISHGSQYPYLPPPPSQYVHPSSIPPPHSYPPPTNPPPGFDPYAPPPTGNPGYPPPTTYAQPMPPTSMPAPQHSYPPPGLHQSHAYSFPPTHLPPPALPPPRPYPPPSLPYPGPGDPHQGYGGGSRNYPPGSGARNDIPALTEIKITGRSDWNNMNR